MSSLISFRRLREDDLPQLLTWFRSPHVAQWWPLPASANTITAKYLPRIQGKANTRMFAILADATPIGMAQISPAGEQHAAGPDACSIDLLIGDVSLTNSGLGPRVIDTFVKVEVFGQRNFSVCLADPQEDNRRSIRAFEKAGFTQC